MKRFNVFERIARWYPDLEMKLKQSGKQEEPSVFVKKSFFASFYMTTGIMVFIILLLLKFKAFKLFMLLLIPIFFAVFLFYFINTPTVAVKIKESAINKEVVFAGRFIVIELESGVPLYDTLRNAAKRYKAVGKVLRQVVEDVDLGSSMEDAINEVVEFTPSEPLQKIFWQMSNALKTGTDISKSLAMTMEHITMEQVIQVKEYGRKLNMLVMFYMMIAVILPSLGITMMIVISSFLSFQFNLPFLLLLVGLLAFVQYMFLSYIQSSRPAVEL